MATPIDAHVCRCNSCGAWKFNDRPCPDCETHKPDYYIDERWDELYITCSICGQEWPCDAPYTPTRRRHDRPKQA